MDSDLLPRREAVREQTPSPFHGSDIVVRAANKGELLTSVTFADTNVYVSMCTCTVHKYGNMKY